MRGTWRQDHLPEIVATLANRPGHESVRTLITDILHHGFGVDYHAIDHEVQMPEVHGRADVTPQSDPERQRGETDAGAICSVLAVF